MGVLTDLNNNLKKHSYTVITAIIIAVLIGGYITFILPANKIAEDIVNTRHLKNIEQQFNKFVDDKLKEINADSITIKDIGFSKCISEIKPFEIAEKDINGIDKTIKIQREIYYKSADTLKKTSARLDPSKASKITIDFSEFLKRIEKATSFDAFYICPIDSKGNCNTKKELASRNIPVADLTYLTSHNKENGGIVIKNSTKRYYIDQITIAGTSQQLFFAVGLDNSDFQTNIRFIKSQWLILSLMLVIMLTLSISFIKPIISSHNETLGQSDLIMVIFSGGTLCALFVVFVFYSYWSAKVKDRNTEDLKDMVTYIDDSFSQQVQALNDMKTHSIFKQHLDSTKVFEEMKFTDTAVVSKEGQWRHKIEKDGTKLLKISNRQFSNAEMTYLRSLDSYFKMDKNALITMHLSLENPGVRRIYADREYFKSLQKTKDKVVLTSVQSRESGAYQWIYAVKDSSDYQKITADSTRSAIIGMAFREIFSDRIRISPETKYMIVDHSGTILMHSDFRKNISQKLPMQRDENSELLQFLSGSGSHSFEMQYQGREYQVYAQKMEKIGLSEPIYILGMRNLSHLSYLSLFAFGNSFVISVLYGIFMLLITLVYSSIFYSGKLRVFSSNHFHHLFPNNANDRKYWELLLVNTASVLLLLGASFVIPPSLLLFYCFVFGVNTAFLNFIVLSVYNKTFLGMASVLLVSLLFSVVLPLVLFHLNYYFFGCLSLFGTHIALIFHYRSWRNGQTDATIIAEAKDKNKGVRRIAYTSFLTTITLNHFAVFPLLLVSAFYTTELDDYARFYCSAPKIENQMRDKVSKSEAKAEKQIFAYGCDCGNPIKSGVSCSSNDSLVHHFGFLKRPMMNEIRNFSFESLSKDNYFHPQLFNGTNIYAGSILIIFFLLLGLMVYALTNYYGNRFFFYDLMQAAHKKYYPCNGKSHLLTTEYVLLPMVSNKVIPKLIKTDMLETIANEQSCPESTAKIDGLFTDAKQQITSELRMEFVLNINQQLYEAAYIKTLQELSREQLHVLFDFAEDHFVNYKNKDVLMRLMEKGIIIADRITGRLVLMNPGFRLFIRKNVGRNPKYIDAVKPDLSQAGTNNSTQDTEETTGTFGKLKYPIFILAVSALLLLMNLQRESFDEVALFGGSIATVVGLVSKLLSFGKPG